MFYMFYARVGVRVRVRFMVLGMHFCSSDMFSIRVRIRVCQYAHTQVWGLWIRVKATAYAEKRETN